MSKLEVKTCPIEGLYIITPRVHRDSRGFFAETYNYRDYAEAGISARFVQSNVSRSAAGVLRGLHFQTRRPQAKLVSVTRGAAFDVAVDLRKNSPTLGQWYGLILTEESLTRFYIPSGFAHGFYALADGTELNYMVDDYYDPGGEGGIIYNDADLAIDWHIKPGEAPILADRDRLWGTLREYLSEARHD